MNCHAEYRITEAIRVGKCRMTDVSADWELANFPLQNIDDTHQVDRTGQAGGYVTRLGQNL
jgi:hypothetical protein